MKQPHHTSRVPGARAAERARARSSLRYPEVPGWRDPTTSLDAAKRVKDKSKVLRARILAHLELVPLGLSAHEIARSLELPSSVVQPRLSELRSAGRIKPSGRRVRNESGATAHIWVLWPEGRPRAYAPAIASEEPR